ncbi:hypothetical protein ACFSJS_05465 [Streptomyces desertarenae]|uniref:LigA protein n=1 Tax=Streptomyces desertarenae TaxID=2666184 RepID=A0ABW4PEJ5_9ACTN
MNGPLIAPVTSSPVRRLLKFRFGPETQRAMVFLTEHGDDRLEPPRGGDFWGYPRPALREVWRGDFLNVLWVSLAERRCWVEVPARTTRSSSHPAPRYEIAWKIGNPVVAARYGVTEEDVRSLIARHAGADASLPGIPDPLKQPPPRHGTVQVEPPGRARAIEEAGIVYWFLDPPAGFLTGPGSETGPALPPVFGEVHQEAYRFYRQVVAGGPADLVAFWLLQHPEQAREVLDWTVAHRDLLSDRDSWERTLAATLGGLTEEDRSFVGVNLARVLSDIGVPQGEEVLRRVEHGVPHRGMSSAHEESR